MDTDNDNFVRDDFQPAPLKRMSYGACTYALFHIVLVMWTLIDISVKFNQSCSDGKILDQMEEIGLLLHFLHLVTSILELAFVI